MFQEIALTMSLKLFEDVSINLFKWFLDNQLKANSNKIHSITSKQSCTNIKIGA